MCSDTVFRCERAGRSSLLSAVFCVHMRLDAVDIPFARASVVTVGASAATVVALSAVAGLLWLPGVFFRLFCSCRL